MANKSKQDRERVKQDFLRTFFDKPGYQEREVNGFFLVKAGGGKEVVGIYTPETFKRFKEFQEILREQGTDTEPRELPL